MSLRLLLLVGHATPMLPPLPYAVMRWLDELPVHDWIIHQCLQQLRLWDIPPCAPEIWPIELQDKVKYAAQLRRASNEENIDSRGCRQGLASKRLSQKICYTTCKAVFIEGYDESHGTDSSARQLPRIAI